MRILLVDDEKELVSALAERLAFRGLEADFATTGEQALEMARRTPYDVAVLDVKMPRMGGLELCQTLQQVVAGIHCIFLTGHGSEQDFQDGVTKGFAYLIKPVRLETLLEKIREARGEAT